MTDISDVLSSLKKVNLIIDEIQIDLVNSLKGVKKGFEDIKQPIQELIEFEKRQNNEQSKYDSGNLAISREISNLTEEKSSAENQLNETQNSFTDISEKRIKLELKKKEMIVDFSNAEKKLEGMRSELNNESITNQKIKAEINQTTETNDLKIAEIEKQIEKLRNEIRKTKGERLALEYLIKKGYIEFNELKIINTLEGRKTTDVATITKVTGLSESLITKTLNGLMKRNVLTYNSSTGAIIIIGSLRI